MTDRPERIAILGGGISALTTAYWLSSTQELRDKYDVTVHQMGWRLGGKLASSRQGPNDRNIEHGLHVWFGCYDNSFAMLGDVYQQWPAPSDFPFKTSLAAFLPQRYTPIGEIIDDEYTFWHFHWPESPGTPGDGQEVPTAVAVIGDLMGVIARAIERLIGDHGANEPEAPAVPDSSPDHPLAKATKITEAVAWIEKTISNELMDEPLLPWALKEIHEKLMPHLDAVTDGNVDAHHLRNFVDVGFAAMRGFLNPEYGIVHDWNLDRIDHLEFREWLKANGGRPEIIDHWSFIRALYDTMFEYVDGDTKNPSYAAGTAVRVFMRIALTYKGTVMYLVKAGMGDLVIAPMYELLKQRGVSFEFFHKVGSLNLTPDGKEIASIDIDVQATLANDTYPATRTEGGFVIWPPEPVWSALEDGEQYKAAGVNFESKWNQPAPAERLTLHQGVDFDRVVLGISLGGFQPPTGSDMCRQLTDANPAFADMVTHLGLVPSIGIQFWMTPTLEGLGWKTGKPAAVGWSRPNTVWADMSQVIDYENWGESRPGSLHYLCGTLATDLHTRPASDPNVPAEAYQIALQQTIEQFETTTDTIWPDATQAKNPAALNYDDLFDPGDGQGQKRLESQYIRANVDPTETCVGSHKDTTRYRLRADESGFTNLILCGAWTRTALNSTCVEAAVMSGMAAARAVSGSPETIIGEHFFGPPPEGK
ncbi:MAG: hypothetical protein BMS9Abin07_1828 [Acidimicrobiia bacterium]|nr:MAG: hypothetical protein BMS9Abin07_1828 [Acidimicrobiia bacterium]